MIVTRTTKGFLCAIVVSVLAAIVAGLVGARTDPSPLHRGSKADDAWDYVHTGVVFEATSKGAFHIRKKARWYADVHGIHAETRFFFRTNQLFATRHITYAVDTNSTISNIGIGWKLHKPF